MSNTRNPEITPEPNSDQEEDYSNHCDCCAKVWTECQCICHHCSNDYSACRFECKHVKCVKITTLGELEEVINHKADSDWIQMDSRDGWSLPLAETWQFKKYKLSMITQGFFRDDDDDNLTASLLYNQMRKGNQTMICGPVFIFNENTERTIDITVDEVKAVISQAAFLYKREHMT